jgi:hypothetical protein
VTFSDAIFSEDTAARHREKRPSVVVVGGKPALCSSVPLLVAMVKSVLEVER